MNEAPDAPTTIRKRIPLRRVFFAGRLAAVLYVGSFAINTCLGGYWGEVERDGRDR
jgi:hypothetical protein